MPKAVDHDERRREIIEATWRLIARQGIAKTSMREIAREMGIANGGLMPYFPHKAAILTAAFLHVSDRTNRRFEDQGERRGVEAVRGLMLELLPLDEERVLEARIAMAFWEAAASDASMSAKNRDAMQLWRNQLLDFLLEARKAGEARADLDRGIVVDELMAIAMGPQIFAVLTPHEATPQRQLAVLDDYLDRIRA